MRPIKALRLFLQRHPDTEPISSQLGLAQLVDRSESLVRAIEGGRLEMSRKFAKALAEKTGVSQKWLLLPDADPENVPSESGGPLRHEEVARRAIWKIDQKLKSADLGIASVSFERASGELSPNAPLDIRRRMARTISGLMEEVLLENLNRGDMRLMEEVTRLLARHESGTGRGT